MSTAIKLVSVSKQFKDTLAVNDISLELDKGRIHGFLGPNGSGKTTTLKMLLGLIKPTSGSIEIFEQSLRTNRAQLMHKIGCIVEKPDFYNYLTGLENLEIAARAYGIRYASADYKKLLEKVGLIGAEKQRVKTYSHGMKQRLGLAQAILHNPDLIVLDEPNTGLDPQGILDLRHLIFSLCKEQGKTILFSSHILSEVQEICDTITVLHKGKVIVQGNISELVSTNNMQVRLEVNNASETETLLKNASYSVTRNHSDEELLTVSIAKKEIPELLQLLLLHKQDIFSVDYKNKLEEYFLEITKEQKA